MPETELVVEVKIKFVGCNVGALHCGKALILKTLRRYLVKKHVFLNFSYY